MSAGHQAFIRITKEDYSARSYSQMGNQAWDTGNQDLHRETGRDHGVRRCSRYFGVGGIEGKGDFLPLGSSEAPV